MIGKQREDSGRSEAVSLGGCASQRGGPTVLICPGLRSSRDAKKKFMTDLGKPGQVGDSIMNTFLASQIKSSLNVICPAPSGTPPLFRGG